MPSNGASELFLRLLYALDVNFHEAAVIWVLLARGAHQNWYETSSNALSGALGSLIRHRTLHRALEALVERGLVERQSHPNYLTKYRVNTAALGDLLARPLPDARFLPGLGTELIPGLPYAGQQPAQTMAMEECR